MAKLLLIKTGQTTFETQSRIESAAGDPLSEQGVNDVLAVGSELPCGEVAAVFCSPGEAEQESAGLIAHELGQKIRTEAQLREIDYGMWQGLTLDEIQRRNMKVYRQWREAPTTVRPPGGETLDVVQERIRKAVQAIVKRRKDETVVIVLRPVALALLRCVLEHRPIESIWEQVDPAFTWCSYQLDEVSLNPSPAEARE